jgi:predicted TIM-barrel fold metal-dependent hydrolase
MACSLLRRSAERHNTTVSSVSGQRVSFTSTPLRTSRQPAVSARVFRSSDATQTSGQSVFARQSAHTFARFNFPPTFLDLLLEIGVSRIMFSADYPYGSMAKARAFLEQIPVSAADRARIAHGNAESLFRL